MPEDSRLQTVYRHKYRDWKQKPYFVNKKDIYVPPKAEFKTDSEYEFSFKVMIIDIRESSCPEEIHGHQFSCPAFTANAVLVFAVQQF